MQNTPDTKPALKEPPKDATKLSPTNSPAAQKKSVKFADDAQKKEKQNLATQSPSQRRKNDVKTNDVTPVTAQAKEPLNSPLNQDTNIPTNRWVFGPGGHF